MMKKPFAYMIFKRLTKAKPKRQLKDKKLITSIFMVN